MHRPFALAIVACLATAPHLSAQSTDATATDSTTTAETPAAEPAPLVNQSLTITNMTAQIMVQFTVTPIAPEPSATDGTATTADAPAAPPLPGPAELLRGAIITAGSYGILTIPGGASLCQFTLSAVFADGSTQEIQQDICAQDSVIFG